MDLAVLVLCYKVERGSSTASPMSCMLVGGSEMETIVTCSGFLEAGSYVVLPLAFNHWNLAVKQPPVVAEGTTTPDSRPCTIAIHSSKEIQCQENIETGPGFLADSIFLLPGNKNTVSYYYFHLLREGGGEEGREVGREGGRRGGGEGWGGRMGEGGGWEGGREGTIRVPHLPT